MAEFIFDLQRFEEGGAGDGSSSGAAGNEGSGNEQGDDGGNATGGSGWETRPSRREKGEIVFPLFMDLAEADVFANDSYDVFLEAYYNGMIPELNIRDDISESVDFSRFTGSSILYNDTCDVINLVDSNVGNIIEYFTYNSGDMLSLVFDTGAVLLFDLDQISPWFNFANGESMLYSKLRGEWIPGGDLAEATFAFWNTATRQYGTYAKTDNDGNTINANVDNFAVSQNFNNVIFNTDGNDNIYLYDVTSADILNSSVYVLDTEFQFAFPTSAGLRVKNSTVYSPNFYLADGTSYYYNRDLEEWRDPALKDSDSVEYMARKAAEAVYEKAASEAALYAAGYNVVLDATDSEYSTFPVSRLANSYIYNAPYYDRIYFYDSTSANVTSMEADGAEINFTFDTGAIVTIEYDYNFTPLFIFADGNTIGYDYYTKTWGDAYYASTDEAEVVTINRAGNSLIYQADYEDVLYFSDSVVGNITDAIRGTRYINLYFDTGAVVNVRYVGTVTPDFAFADGSRYFYDSELDQCLSYDSEGFVIDDNGSRYFYSESEGGWGVYTSKDVITFPNGSVYIYTNNGWKAYSTSADLATDDLWGDTFSGTAAADEIFVGTAGNTLVQNVDAQDTIALGAALSDIVETSVTDNTIAIAFNTGVTAVIETSGTSPTFNLSSGESYSYDKQSASWKSA